MKYQIIYADPPVSYDNSSVSYSRRIENHYPTMSIEEIKNMDIPATDDSVLLLWAVSPQLPEALEVMNAWGFEYKSSIVWDKVRIGMGYWVRGQHELLLIGTKGHFKPPIPQNRFSSVIREKRLKHSAKPLILYDMIDKMFPDCSKLELFSRRKTKGWNVKGNHFDETYNYFF